MIYTLLHATVTSLPSYTFHDVGDVAFELMSYDRAEFCLWLQAAVLALPDACPPITVPLTRKQLVGFHTDVTRAESPREVTDAIRAFNRLWR